MAAFEADRSLSVAASAAPTPSQEVPVRAWREGFGLYIHVPYCLQRCGYCDFFTMTLTGARDDQFAPYLEALSLELQTLAPEWAGRPIRSIFFGGGTPSLLTPSEMEQILAQVQAHWTLQDDAEVTLEINPETMDLAKARALREAGINRASMGMQTLNPEGLALLGRNHSPEGARRCYDILRDAGFASVSCDMIYGWPGQTNAGWREELAALMTWEPDHLSLYELILEPGTPMTRSVRKGELVLPPEEERLAMYRSAREVATAAGLVWYETSNYARPGCEARHNVDNWNGSDYLGLGPGAHSFRGQPGLGARRANPRNMPKYLSQPAASPWAPRSAEEVCVEAMLNGLRLRDGWNPDTVHEQYGFPLRETLAPALDALVRAGYMEPSLCLWTLTPRGAELLDAVLGHLQSHLSSASFFAG